MKTSQTIVFTGLMGLIAAGLLAPTIYATEDGQFPVFPTIIEGNSSSTETIVSPATPAKTQKTTATKTTTATSESVKQKSYVTTNESGVFSPWGTVKQGLFGNANASGEGVILALAALDSKPVGRGGDLRYQIAYANNTGETLRNVSIQVFLPKNFQYLDSDLKPDSKGNGMVVYELGKVAAGESGAIQLEVRARKKVRDAFLSVTMAYEDIDSGAHTVNATASNAFNGENGGGLSASVLDGAGGFMVWLFVIILLIALAFVAYQYFVLQASARRVSS